MGSQKDDNKMELTKRRNEQLPAIISSLNDEKEIVKHLEKMKVCIDYLQTFELYEIEKELLQFVMPIIKTSLIKLFEDNVTLSELAEDDLIPDILKQNLKISSEFMEMEKVILEFMLNNNEVKLKEIFSIPLNTAVVIKAAFEHCKNSSESYKSALNIELLEIFRLTQEVHSLFLKLIETSLTVEEVDIPVLLEVLNIICCISDTLTDMNMKSLITNWQGYTGITVKFSDMLKGHLDLKIPFRILSDDILKKLTVLESLKTADLNRAIQVVKVTNFSLKVGLKLADAFWEVLDEIQLEFFQFCCICYRFHPDYFSTLMYPEDLINLVKSRIYETIEPMLYKLINLSLIERIVESVKKVAKDHNFGILNFLNNILKCAINSKQVYNNICFEDIVEEIFYCIEIAFIDFFYNYNSDRNIFDNLVLNISAIVFIFPKFYPKIEQILLRNLFKKNLWNPLLAIDVWCLILSNSQPQFQLQTLQNLLEVHRKLNFGIYTRRLEEVYFKCLIRKIFDMLPYSFKISFSNKYPLYSNKDVWVLIGFDSFNESVSLESFVMECLDEKYPLIQVKNMELLSTVNFSKVDLKIVKKLVKIVSSFWESVQLCPQNSAFGYFINGLCKLTGRLCFHFDDKQLTNIFEQLEKLSARSSCKLLVCDMLRCFADRNFNDPEGLLSMSHVISSLVTTRQLVIKQNILEFIESLTANGKQDVVARVMRSCPNNIQVEIEDYLKKNVPRASFKRDYYEKLEKFTLKHECVRWRSSAPCKKPKLEIKETKVEIKQVRTKIEENDENTTLDDVISNLRSEVKCLMKIMKTEKLSAKNVSDLKTISNQLMSLM